MTTRDVCPYCGLDALTGPSAHLARAGCVHAWRSKHYQYRRRIMAAVMDKVEEVKNQSGGVVGYTLKLNADETEQLLRAIE